MSSQPETGVSLAPITGHEARDFAGWRYLSPYNFYDGSEAEILVLCDPANGYRGVHVDGEFVGFVCSGPDALVPGQTALSGVDDIGWGFRPDLVGRGLASRWLAAALAELTSELAAPRQRVTIIAWNDRSRAVAHRLGFDDPVTHTNDDGDWIVLTRARSEIRDV